MHHNIESRNQLSAWSHTVSDYIQKEEMLLDEYYECLIDCDIGRHASGCRRMCKDCLLYTSPSPRD